MRLLEAQFAFIENVAKLISFAFDAGYFLSGGELFRTEEQAKIYAENGKGIVNSQHCKRLAIDFNLFSKDKKYLRSTDDYRFLGNYWLSLNQNNRWGGDFKRRDGNHFEMFV